MFCFRQSGRVEFADYSGNDENSDSSYDSEVRTPAGFADLGVANSAKSLPFYLGEDLFLFDSTGA